MLDFIYWNADPVLISFGPIAIRWYGLAFAIGFTIGYWIVSAMFKHEGAPEKWLGILLMYLVIATIVGARLGHVFFMNGTIIPPIRLRYSKSGKADLQAMEEPLQISLHYFSSRGSYQKSRRRGYLIK